MALPCVPQPPTDRPVNRTEINRILSSVIEKMSWLCGRIFNESAYQYLVHTET
jgi:hypothetical protein